MDQQFIELFDVSNVRVRRKYIPPWPEIQDDVFVDAEDSEDGVNFGDVEIENETQQIDGECEESVTILENTTIVMSAMKILDFVI